MAVPEEVLPMHYVIEATEELVSSGGAVPSQ